MTIEELKKLAKNYVMYHNIKDFIRLVFPEYEKSEIYYDETNKDLDYIYLAGLSLMAFEDLDNRVDLDLATRLLQFTDYVINNFGDSKNTIGSDSLENLFGIEVFENLTGYKKGPYLAKKYLTDKALQSFHDTTLYYHTEEFLDEYFKVFNIHPIKVTDPESLFAYMWNEVQRPRMNPPEDNFLLWDIRTNLELNEDLIAGILSCIVGKRKPIEISIKKFYELQKVFVGHREQLNKHEFSIPNGLYVREMLSFIDDLERIYSNTRIWMWNHGIKSDN